MIAVGTAHDLTLWAGLGALSAVVLVLLVGLALHRPGTRAENTLKFVVGLMLSSFGVFWTGEGLGADWPGADLALLWIFAIFVIFSLGAVRLLTKPVTEVTR